MVDGHDHLARLDDRLERVRELRDHVQLQRGLAVVGAEAGGGVGHGGVGGAPHHGAAQPLEALLQRREVLDAVGVAVAHHHVGVAGDDRLHQLHDVPAVVLVVGVGVHDHVGAELQAGVEPGLEGGRQPLVVGEPHDVVHAVRAGDVDRVVGGAVVDHEPLHAVDARHLARQVGERVGQLGALVEAGDLDDQLHCKEGHKGRAGSGSHAAFTFVVFSNQWATSLLASPSSLRPRHHWSQHTDDHRSCIS